MCVSNSQDHWNQTNFYLLNEKANDNHVIFSYDIVRILRCWDACRVNRRWCTFRSHFYTIGFRSLDRSYTTFFVLSSTTGSFTCYTFVFNTVATFFSIWYVGLHTLAIFCNFRKAKIAFHARAFATFSFLEKSSHSPFCL